MPARILTKTEDCSLMNSSSLVEGVKGGRLLRVGLLVGIFLLGLSLRVCRINEEPIDLDDANGTICLDEPTVSAYLRCFYDPEGSIKMAHTPLYFLGQYGWTRLFGRTPAAMRWLTILFSVATIPFVYLLGAQLVNRDAGLFGALLFALSPQHIHQSLSIKMYPLLVLCVAMSVAALVRARRTGRLVWWGLNALANLAVFWTHFYGVLLAPVEGLVLLVSRPRMGTVVRWSVVHVILLLPSLAWLFNRRELVAGGSLVFGLMDVPGLGTVFKDVLGGDALGMTHFPVSHAYHGSWGLSLNQVFIDIQPVVDRAMVSVFVLAAALCVLLLARPALALRLRPERVSSGQAGASEARPYTDLRAGVAALSVLALGPALLLMVASHLWRPCYQVRYTMYASIGLYLLAGSAWSYVPWRRVRLLLGAMLLALYGFQLSVLLTGSSRTDYYKAAGWIQAEGTPSDPLMVGQSDGGNTLALADVFRQHLPRNWQTIPVHTVEESLIRLSRSFEPLPAKESGKELRAWVVFDTHHDLGSLAPNFEASLHWRGFRWSRREFPVSRGLIVFKIEPDEEVRGTKEAAVAPESVLQELGIAFANETEGRQALEFLGRRVFRPLPSIERGGDALGLASEFLEPGGQAIAGALAERGIEMEPGNPGGYLIRAIALALDGDDEEATTQMRKGLELLPPVAQRFYRPLLVAMERTGDLAQCRESVARLVRLGQPVPFSVLEASGLTGWVDVGMHLSKFER